MSEHLAPVLMIQGTASSVGKSTLVAGLCRLFVRRGIRVAPFKAQNMSNNAAVCPGGGEIGRAQYAQAVAARVVPTVDMNPILLKPQADRTSQLIVLGHVRGTRTAQAYWRGQGDDLWPVVSASLDRLRADYELVIAEGAGSPAEINLRSRDLVNMRLALHAQADVLLVGDIDRGGVFAALLGTWEWLAEDERALVRGFILNRFRGDPALLAPAPQRLQKRTGVAVLGVVPWLDNLGLPEEDAASLEERLESESLTRRRDWNPLTERRSSDALNELPEPEVLNELPEPEALNDQPASGALHERRRPDAVNERSAPESMQQRSAPDALDEQSDSQRIRGRADVESLGDRRRMDALVEIAIVRLPHLANFDEFGALAAEPRVDLRWVSRPQQLRAPDLVILPGTKATIPDLIWLAQRGLAVRVRWLALHGTPVLGICGGFQMLGNAIHDPLGIESERRSAPGLQLLRMETELSEAKRLARTSGRVRVGCAGIWNVLGDLPVDGYEIHLGRTVAADPDLQPLLELVGGPDGAVVADGSVAGTYLHGLLERPEPRWALVGALAARRGLDWQHTLARAADPYDRLADVLEACIELEPARLPALANCRMPPGSPTLTGTSTS